MSYFETKVDKKNLAWFDKDETQATLLNIELRRGELRGLRNLKLQLSYPISAIAGKNGSGKSTVLALAACAYHNSRRGYNPQKRNSPYYTFSDFFIQATEEVSPEGISIWYQFLHDNWRRNRKGDKKNGPGWQERFKKYGGRWNNYYTRIKKNVVFLGIQRIVPHSETSVSKSYRRVFKKLSPSGWENEVRKSVSRVLGIDYDDFWYKGHSKYKLPVVETEEAIYSGFNMGAGENGLFNIFSTIYGCEDGLLLLIDEIELGLHEEAQVRLIDELKRICLKKHMQVICTTHSHTILNNLPPQGRFFLERFNGKTTVTPEISPDFAAGKMSGRGIAELDVYVEDEVAAGIVMSALEHKSRIRCNILRIGSSLSVIRQLAARYKEPDIREACVLLDGDMFTQNQKLRTNFLNFLESYEDKEEAQNWFDIRVGYLPGDMAPEKWILSQCAEKDDLQGLSKEIGVEEGQLSAYIKQALYSEKHREFRDLSEKLSLNEHETRSRFTKHALDEISIQAIANHICRFLD